MSNMITLAADINEMEEYVPLPSGPYVGEIRDVEVRYSEKQPNGYFYITLRIDPDEFPADYDHENAPDGALVSFARVSVPDPNNRRSVRPFKALLTALGLEKGSKFDTGDWIGKEVQVMLSEREYQGVPVNNVEGLNPVPKV